MPKYYCDYCCTHLTHDSRSVRRTHNTGRKHCDNVREYYRRWFDSRIQEMIDKTTAVYENNMAVQQAAYMPPGGFMPAPYIPPNMNEVVQPLPIGIPHMNMMRPPPMGGVNMKPPIAMGGMMSAMNMQMPPPNMRVPPPGLLNSQGLPHINMPPPQI